MSGGKYRTRLADLGVGQWGLLTTAQAKAAGVSRVQLARLAQEGELERMAHGVYATPEAAAAPISETRALWLSLDPSRTAEERLADLPTSGVISHESAARLHGTRTLRADALHVTLPRRYRTARPELRPHTARLRPGEIEILDGLPVTTLTRTVGDLLAERTDLAHVADVVATGRYAAELVDVDVDAAAAGAGRGYDVTDQALATRLEDLVADAAPVSALLEQGGAVVAQLAGPLDTYRRILAANPSLLAQSDEVRRLGAHLAELIEVPALEKARLAAPRIPVPPGVQAKIAHLDAQIAKLSAYGPTQDQREDDKDRDEHEDTHGE
jgi:hypothetical protein